VLIEEDASMRPIDSELDPEDYIFSQKVHTYMHAYINAYIHTCLCVCVCVCV
jgi:hypothetical protein